MEYSRLAGAFLHGGLFQRCCGQASGICIQEVHAPLD
jgi:hypothetical protein